MMLQCDVWRMQNGIFLTNTSQWTRNAMANVLASNNNLPFKIIDINFTEKNLKIIDINCIEKRLRKIDQMC